MMIRYMMYAVWFWTLTCTSTGTRDDVRTLPAPRELFDDPYFPEENPWHGVSSDEIALQPNIGLFPSVVKPLSDGRSVHIYQDGPNGCSYRFVVRKKKVEQYDLIANGKGRCLPGCATRPASRPCKW